MDELIQQVVAKVGIDASQARGAVDTVLGFLKERLPAPIAAQVDGLLSGGAGGVKGQTENAMGALGGLGGMLGGLGGDKDKGSGGTGGGF